jgi:hypothetical protein
MDFVLRLEPFKIQNGDFREDLFYRLNVYPVTCPLLRDHGEDVSLLVKHFVDKYSTKIGKKIDTVPKKIRRSVRPSAVPTKRWVRLPEPLSVMNATTPNPALPLSIGLCTIIVKARENGSADEEIIDEINEIVKKIPGVKETNVRIITV